MAVAFVIFTGIVWFFSYLINKIYVKNNILYQKIKFWMKKKLNYKKKGFL